MANPTVVATLRGDMLESWHRAALAVKDARGQTIFSFGDIERPIFPRSAVKALQAIALVERGGFTRYDFTDAELALACASHNSEAVHADAALSMLHKLDLGEAALACGPHVSLLEKEAHVMLRSGSTPGPRHNNCSGKHAAMLALADLLGAPVQGYEQVDHPVQVTIREVLSEMVGIELDPSRAGIDGCSVPSYPIPLASLAFGFARFGTGEGLSPLRERSVAKIRAVCAAHPYMVAGRERFCTEVMQRFGRRVFVKTGAEGVFCAAFPEQGFGAALKVDDGAGRASEALMARLIAAVIGANRDEEAFLDRWSDRPVRNWAGIETGRVRMLSDVFSDWPN
ncbi:MAG: asparaginase [Pseudomonadota bacterium]